MEKLSQFVVRFRWPIIVFFLFTTVLMGFQIKKAKMNADLKTYLPEDMPSRVAQQHIEDIFGGTDMIMVVLETDDVIKKNTLQRVKALSMGMKKIKGIDKVMSLFELKQVRSENDAMLVDPAVKMIPETPEEAEVIKREIRENDLVYGSVISKDFTTTAVIGMVEPGTHEKPLVQAIEGLIKKTPGPEKISLGGSPYMRAQTAANMQKDISRLLPIGLLFMFLFLLISFRQFRGVWLPTLAVIMSIFFSLGLIPVMKWDFTVVSIILAVMLIAIANDYGIHMFAHYQDENKPESDVDKKELSRGMVKSLGKPIIIAGLTTIAGMLCMQGHIIIPASQMGVLAGVGIAYALLASLFFIPAVSSLLPRTKPVITAISSTETRGLNRVLSGLVKTITEKPIAVIAAFLIVTIVFISGIFSLSVNSNPAKLYPEGAPVRESSELINRELGGFFPVSIVFEGDIRKPGILKKIDLIEKKINDIPEVGTTQSIAKVIRQISRALYSPDELGYDHIPDSYNAISQFLELYLMSGDPDDFEKMVDFSFHKAMILVRFRELNTPVLRKCVREIKEMVKNEPSVTLVGGNADVFSQMDKEIVKGQFRSLFISLAVVFLIILGTFRSIKSAVLQMLSLVFAIVLLFGMMGYAGIELNFMTALLSSIMIGVGIDYTTHFVWRYRRGRLNDLDPKEAIRVTILSTGRGIILNALSVMIGFAALLFSSFLPVRYFGLIMVSIIFACLVGALLLIPSVLITLDYRKQEKIETNINLLLNEEK